MVDYKLTKKLEHIAFIMDGNGRWAKKRLLPRTRGHKEACSRIIEVLRACKDLNIKVASLYAFSTENWNRPQDEIDKLFEYLDDFFNDYIQEFIETGVRVSVMGDITRLPKHTQETIEKAKKLTENNTKIVFNICLNYGGRQEIVRATKLIVEDIKAGKLDENELDTEKFNDYLYSSGLPEVDLMIRTSGESRISNFLLYQLAYSEFIFTPTYWPDFTVEKLIECADKAMYTVKKNGKNSYAWYADIKEK